MTDIPAYIDVLAKSLCEARGDVWKAPGDDARIAWRMEARYVVAKIKQADFVILPRKLTDDMRWRAEGAIEDAVISVGDCEYGAQLKADAAQNVFDAIVEMWPT